MFNYSLDSIDFTALDFHKAAVLQMHTAQPHCEVAESTIYQYWFGAAAIGWFQTPRTAVCHNGFYQHLLD